MMNRRVGRLQPTSGEVAAYWNRHIHDAAVSDQPVGSPAFFRQLEAYRFSKLDYLPKQVDFDSFGGKELLEVGCGLGIDLARFCRGRAIATGVDLAPRAIQLAEQNLAQQGLVADLSVMDGESMSFPDERFDLVYAHGVVQYTAQPESMISEIYRVLRPGGQAIVMVYNRHSWLNALAGLTGVGLEHADAPVLRKYSSAELRHLLSSFAHVRIVPERFPVKTQLHRGLKARLFNTMFVKTFNLLPKALVRPLGWHLMAFVRK